MPELVDLDLQRDKRLLADLLKRYGHPLQGDGGDGTSGGMEARVAKLEAHMEHVLQDVSLMKADVGTLKTDMAAIKVKIDNLPSKDFVVKVVVGSAAVLGALQVFGPFLAKLLGLK